MPDTPTPPDLLTCDGGMSKRLVSGRTVTRWYWREQLEAGTDLPSQEVTRALWDLQRAEGRGFTGCRAVFVNARFDGLDEAISREQQRAGGGWGRGQDVTYRNTVVDGNLVRDESYPTAPYEWSGTRGGYAVHVRTNYQGARCGYVTVPAGHPAHGKGYDDDLLGNVSVHGGLTYAEPEEDGGWTFGFDCSHYGDAGHPEWENGNTYRRIFDGGEYRSLDYVQGEIESLARALLALASPEGR
jgi:hypothetical protein